MESDVIHPFIHPVSAAMLNEPGCNDTTSSEATRQPVLPDHASAWPRSYSHKHILSLGGELEQPA